MKYFILLIFTLIAFQLNAQLTHPQKMIYSPIEYDSVSNFINDSSAYAESKLALPYLDRLAILYSFLGNYDKAETLFAIKNKRKGYIPDQKIQLDLTKFEINQDTLIELYKNYNVVLFNEAHHISRHRAFLYSQLEVLKELGFNQLALEALNPQDTEIQSRTYPISNFPSLTGVYINDPVYGNVIRKAIEFGFTLISYDAKKRREKRQAENIYKQYDPKKGKLIVYGGYGHIAEEYPMMGSHLKKALKEDVLSISQFTQYSMHPIFPENSDFKIYLHADLSKYMDYYIYFNIPKSNTNVPAWYPYWMNFKTVALSTLHAEPIEGTALIQLLNIGEEYGVPVYQYWSQKEEIIHIAYPKAGEYILRIVNKKGEIKKTVKLH